MIGETEIEEMKNIAMHLARLIQFEIKTKSDLQRWYQEANLLESRLSRPESIGSKLPHFLSHFFIDADIRMKDAKYKTMQFERVSNLIDYLNKGIYPTEKDI